METVSINNGELPNSHASLIRCPEIRDLLEGVKKLSDSFLDSPSLDLSHLDKVVEFEGKEYEITINS